MQHLVAAADLLPNYHVLVVADVMLDDYIDGTVSPAMEESGAPVFAVSGQDFALGGAANAAANIQMLGGAATLVVDPPCRFPSYAGADVVTPNVHELPTVPDGRDLEGTVAALADQLRSAVLATRGAEGGVKLFRSGASPVHRPTLARKILDAVGAGDTVVAMLALALASGIALEIAIELACVAAAAVVTKRGTSIVSRAELVAALRAR